jgi:hypothetical protein
MAAPKVIRSQDWWEPKITLVIAIGLLSIHGVGGDEIFSALVFLIKLCGFTIVGAIYVSLINDFTDLEDDAKARKNNNLLGFSKIRQIGLISASLFGVVVIFCYLFKLYPSTLALFLGALVSYSIYSFPPIRLKKRGIWGVFADAFGAHVFPALAVFVGIFEFSGKPIPLVPFSLVAIWSMLYGFRGILGHQYLDLVNDKNASLNTFASQTPVANIQKIENWLVFFEIVSFSILLVLFKLEDLFFLLFFYLAIVLFLKRKKEVHFTVIIHPVNTNYTIFLSAYYQVFIVIGIFVIWGFNYGYIFLLLIPIYMVFFPNEICKMAKLSKMMVSAKNINN